MANTNVFLQKKLKIKSDSGLTKGTDGSISVANPVIGANFSVNNNVTILGTEGKKTTKIGGNQLFFPNGAIFGGTAQAAGLVTRGICGVGTPDSTTGACAKDNLYLNYDGDNNYGRKVVLGAGSVGTKMGGGAYTYCAVRGDQMKDYIEAQGFAKASTVGNGKVIIKQNGTEKGSFSLNQGDSLEINLSDTDTHVNVVDNTISTSSTSALSAYQGKLLNDKINELKSNGISVVKVTALPTPSVGLMGKIFMIAHEGHSDDNDFYDEYMVIEKTSSSSVAKQYAWEKIGNTDVKLDGYLKTVDVIDSLDNGSTTNPLSANQGHELSTRLSTAESNISDRYTKAESDLAYVHSGALEYSDINTSYIGSVKGGIWSSPYGSYWDALIRIEHKNGAEDGKYHIVEIVTDLTGYDSLYWRKTQSSLTFRDWKTILDSSNYGSFITKQWLTSALGFGSYQPIISWGSMTSGYTPVWGSDNLHGGGIHFAEKDGQTSMQIDGTFRQREGLYEVIDTSTIGSQRVDYANSAGYATSAGKTAECESTTLLKAEGENLGAKIQSQYTSGSSGSVTYHQATWYVIGNDGETYNLAKMVTTDTFNSKLTEALKTINVEYATRSDVTSLLDSGNSTSSSLSLAYDNSNTTGLTYWSYPNLTINNITGFGVLRGGVDGRGAFQLACPTNGKDLFYRIAEKGATPKEWVKLLTSGNFTPIDNLLSTSTSIPLSANQGRVLNNRFSNYQPLLSSSVGATMQWLSFKQGSSYSISGIWCGSVSMTLNGSVGSNAYANFTISSSYQSSYSNGGWYVCASPVSGGYVDTMAYGVEYTSNTSYGGKIWARRVYSGATTTYSFDIIAIRLC